MDDFAEKIREILKNENDTKDKNIENAILKMAEEIHQMKFSLINGIVTRLEKIENKLPK